MAVGSAVAGHEQRRCDHPAASIPAALLPGLAIPDIGPMAFARLLPALALTLVSLALLTWLTARVTAGVIGVGWVGFVTVLAGPGARDLAWQPPMQLVHALVARAVAAVLFVRLDNPGMQGAPHATTPATSSAVAILSPDVVLTAAQTQAWNGAWAGSSRDCHRGSAP